MALVYKKSISDPIYGAIQLTDLELKAIDTSVFQRLRHVGQLGLANYVFPSANYSRFAHSIGACHTMGQILVHLEEQSDIKLDDQELQLRRLALLLHDIGHYYMSHATEYALQAHKEEQAKTELSKSKFKLESPSKIQYCDHEEVGKLILKHDPEIAAVLQSLPVPGIAETLGAMFKGASEEKYNSLVSSELDADRLDYLMRSSQSSGLPYGHFDRDYLIQNLVVDKAGKVCLKHKAIRAADHFVLCRSFDYLQVVFHKTIVGFEEMLKLCIRYLIASKKIELSKDEIVKAIEKGEWKNNTDASLLELIKSIDDKGDPITTAMARRISRRRPAPLLWSDEEIKKSPKSDARDLWYRQLGHYFENSEHEWCKNCLYWFKHFRPTDASPFRTTYRTQKKEDEAMEKSIQILSVDGRSKALTECKESFTRSLSDQAYIMARIYYIGPDSEEAQTRTEFQKLIKTLKLSDGLRGS